MENLIKQSKMLFLIKKKAKNNKKLYIYDLYNIETKHL